MDAPRDDPTAAALAWLLASDEPAVRHLARGDLLGDRDSDDSAADAARILEGPKVRALLDGQRPDGGFGVGPYSKWSGAHWRLVSLVEPGVPAGEPRLHAAAATVLDWLAGSSHRRGVKVIGGLTRRCASQEGNALAVACRLGMAGDPRAGLLARSLAEWQWPDGGWNCDPRAADALELLVRRRRPDGRWRPGGYWWRRPGAGGTGSGPPEVVDWGRSGPNEMITLNALRVLRAAGWVAPGSRGYHGPVMRGAPGAAGR